MSYSNHRQGDGQMFRILGLTLLLYASFVNHDVSGINKSLKLHNTSGLTSQQIKY